MTAARRAVTATLAAPVTAGWLSADTAPRAQSPRPPNIVLFLVDGLGYMDIGATNPDTFYETPHIDGLAASGVRFTNGYAANPVCSPVRSICSTCWPASIDGTARRAS